MAPPLLLPSCHAARSVQALSASLPARPCRSSATARCTVLTLAATGNDRDGQDLVTMRGVCNIRRSNITRVRHGLLLDTAMLFRVASVAAAAEAGFFMSQALHQSLVGRPRVGVERILIEAFETLDEVRMPLAIATSSDRIRATHHLERAGLLERFDEMATRTDVTDGKPAPDTFLQAAKAIGTDPISS